MKRDIVLTPALTIVALALFVLTGAPLALDRFPLWIAAALTLIAISYGPFFASYLPPKLLSKPYTFS